MTIDSRYRRYAKSLSLFDRLLDHGWSILLYDGDCTLCSGLVGFVAKRTPATLLAFCAMQSPTGQRLLEKYGYPPADNAQTVVLITLERVYVQSEAAIQILSMMVAPWSWCAGFVRSLPFPLRERIYQCIARHRFRIFNRREVSCLVGVTDRRRYLV